MKGKRTRRWWVTRIELAVGIGLVVFMGFWFFVPGSPWGPCDGFGCTRLSPWLLPTRAETAVPLAAFLVAVIGLAWMIRIFRGPRDGSPPWRYRDR
jgi:hypothetical protein